MPFDVHGESIVPGLLYAIGKGTQKVVSETRYCVDSDVLFVRRRRSNDPWNRADEIAGDLEWVPVNEHGEPLGPFSEVHDIVSPPHDPREAVRSLITKARFHKDQLQALEMDAVVAVGDLNNTDVRHAIMQAIHADGSIDSIFELVEA